jgi:dihydrofolate reductase
MISLVVAVSKNGVIGRDGGLPWHISSDLKRFKEITMGKPIIMGRKTWESLPKKPLPGRRNIVLTKKIKDLGEGAEIVGTIDQAITLAAGAPEVCVIGGGEIYRQFLPHANRIYLTEVDLVVEGDTRFPELDDSWREVSREVHLRGEKDTARFVLRVLERA